MSAASFWKSTFNGNLTKVGLCVWVQPLPLIQNHLAGRQKVKWILWLGLWCLFLTSIFNFRFCCFFCSLFLWLSLGLGFCRLFWLRGLLRWLNWRDRFCLLYLSQYLAEIWYVNHCPKVSLNVREFWCKALGQDPTESQRQVTCHNDISQSHWMAN